MLVLEHVRVHRFGVAEAVCAGVLAVVVAEDLTRTATDGLLAIRTVPRVLCEKKSSKIDDTMTRTRRCVAFDASNLTHVFAMHPSRSGALISVEKQRSHFGHSLLSQIFLCKNQLFVSQHRHDVHLHTVSHEASEKNSHKLVQIQLYSCDAAFDARLVASFEHVCRLDKGLAAPCDPAIPCGASGTRSASDR